MPTPRIGSLAPYKPGLSIDEIRERYGLEQVIKLASNENPLGASPLAADAIARNAALAFRYPQGGNPELVKALARRHLVPEDQIVVGNGSDEIIDLLIRTLCDADRHNIVCNQPCFSIYPIQAAIAGVECRRAPLAENFVFDFTAQLELVNNHTRLVFLTTPDNPSGYCPDSQMVLDFASKLEQKAPEALLVIDEAYMDFARPGLSLLENGAHPGNTAFLRTFSKSYGLAGLRLGYAIVPEAVADGFRRARLPFSVNILAEKAGLAALADTAFRQATLDAVASGREGLKSGLERIGCRVWPSEANFLLFQLPERATAKDCFEYLLGKGVIIRPLASYDLPDHLRVSVGTDIENRIFLENLALYLETI